MAQKTEKLKQGDEPQIEENSQKIEEFTDRLMVYLGNTVESLDDEKIGKIENYVRDLLIEKRIAGPGVALVKKKIFNP